MSSPKTRLLSIDMMRGFTLFLMLFVNDLYIPGVPQWLLHTEAHEDGMGLADWVFPGFLFMVGISIPFAIANRQKIGESLSVISRHILLRAGSLILISLLLFNKGALNVEVVGVSKFAWSILLFVAIFLVWNQYPKSEKYYKLFTILQGIGIVLLAGALLFFRSGTIEEVGWMQRGWWGILGLIGWGYLVGALASLWCRDSLYRYGLLVVFFLGLNILYSAQLLGFVDFLMPVFNVILEGNIPFIVLMGVLVGLLIKKTKTFPAVLLRNVIVLGILCLVIGFFLRNWFIISKIYATPSWGLICTGISLLLFAVFYYIVDVKQNHIGLKLFERAGQNSLTTYILPDIVYLIIWTYGLPVFFYKYLGNPLWCIVGSLLWSYVMLWLAVGLSKINIRLKL